MSKNKVITVCGDPGGARAILPVIKLLLKDKNIEIVNYCYNEAKLIFNQEKVNFIPLSEDITTAGKYNLIVQELLLSNKTLASQNQVLLTATSCNNLNFEQLFIANAKALNIASIAVLDFWFNYTARFSDKEGNLDYLPNIIAVMDNNAKQQMIDLGFPKDIIVITGQPAFDKLISYYNEFDFNKVAAIKQSLNVNAEQLLINFVSQPISKVVKSEQNLGFNEHQVLEHLISTLEQITSIHNKSIVLNILPHPRESVEDYINYDSDLITIKITKPANSKDYLMAADLVIGMNSVLLLEACYLKKLVISLQPGLKTLDPLPTNKIGISIGVYAYKDFFSTLEKVLVKDNFSSVNQASKEFIASLKDNSANNVVQQIYDLGNFRS